MLAAAVVMVSPVAFGPNSQTAASNALQRADPLPGDSSRALAEWCVLRRQLAGQGVMVHDFAGATEVDLPDQCFPNNWFSTHPDGTVVLYPLMAENRRAERRVDVLQMLRRNYQVSRLLDLTAAEQKSQFLEGTGSVVIDHRNGFGFAGLSPRTSERLALRLGAELGLEMLTFQTADDAGRAYYHTNVIMSIADEFALWCPAALPDRAVRRRVSERLLLGGRAVIEITLPQAQRFAANLLALTGRAGPVIVLSSSAHDALTVEQAARLKDHGELLPLPLGTLERLGGGSARCLLAEVHLPARRCDTKPHD
jgi:hypothetical protein